METEIVIRSADDLARLRAWSLTPDDASIHLELPEMSDDHRVEWERRLERHAFACGCETGAAAVLTSLVLWLAWVITVGPGWPTALAWLGVGVLGAAIVGKTAGIVWSRFRLDRDIAQLKEYMSRTAVGKGR